MNERDKIMILIQELTGQKNILTIPKIFIDIFGDHTTAIFLSQVIYWHSKVGRPFYKTYAEWKEEIGISERLLDKARIKLEGIVITERHRVNGENVLHYSVNYEKLADVIVSKSQTVPQVLCNSTQRTIPIVPHVLLKTETTTEITKDIPPKVEYDPFKENSPKKKAIQIVTPLSTLKPDQLILAEEFISLWKVPAPPKSQINYWRRGLYDFVQICGSEDPRKVMGETFRAWKKEGCRFSISTPNSILRYAGAVIGKRKTSSKTYIGADGEILDEGGNRIVFDGMTVN